MKKILVPLLALLLLLASIGATADGSDAVTLEVNTGKNKVYMSDDPYLASLRGDAAVPEGDALSVLVLPVKKGIQLQVTVKPATVKNKKVILSVDDEAVVRVQGTGLTGLKAGETVLTIASEADPDATVQYRVLVIRQVSRISLTASEKSVAVGGCISLTPEFAPEDATLKQVSWSSDNEKIATVDQDGIVTGMKRGSVRMIATAQDGSNVRANISVQVVQLAEEITLKETEVTVDTGRNVMLHATVLPADTNDKNVVWTSSDESIATVNTQGRVTGVSLGDCEIICSSKTAGNVQAKAIVHVQQPVKKVTFDEAPVIYVNETGKLTWTIEPENASNQALELSSSNEKILKVSEDGTVTGIKAGETWVNAVTTDGTNRRARVKVKIYQHVTGVKMKRNVAYIDVGQTSTAGAILEPKTASNNRMTWESGDTAIATVDPVKKEPHRVKITGVTEGETVVTGTTEDGGFQASLIVRIGNWEKALTLKDAYVKGADVYLTVKNDSALTITSITAEVSVFDVDGKPVPANSEDGSNTFKVVYKKTLKPGASTKEKDWKYVDFKLPESTKVSEYVVKITQFQIDNDWIKTIQKKHQPTKNCPVHL